MRKVAKRWRNFRERRLKKIQWPSAFTAARRSHSGRVSGALRAADAVDGDDSAARGGAAELEGEAQLEQVFSAGHCSVTAADQGTAGRS